MNRPLKRSFAIKGHRTSISLEKAFWDALKEAAAEEGVALAGLVAEIDAKRGATGLSSAVRIFLLERYRDRAAGTNAIQGAVPLKSEVR
ncbi:MAG: ribbon-helix-helix domain-containing protein [Hyphomicrobium sp.]